MKETSFARSRTPSKYLDALARIARLCEKARERIEIGQYELKCHYPEGEKRLSVAVSDVIKLEEHAVRIFRKLLR